MDMYLRRYTLPYNPCNKQDLSVLKSVQSVGDFYNSPSGENL